VKLAILNVLPSISFCSARVSVLVIVLSNNLCERIVKWEHFQISNEDTSSVRVQLKHLRQKLATELLDIRRTRVADVTSAHRNHGKKISMKRNSGRRLHWREKQMIVHRKGLFSKITELLQHR
jgi:hypothetical protein